MYNIIKKIKDGDSLVLWVGDALSKMMGFPTKKDLARIICNDIKEGFKTSVEDKKSLSEVSQLYLDSISGSKTKLLKKIKSQYIFEEDSPNPLKLLVEAPFVDSVITTSIDNLVEQAYGNKVFKVNYYSEDLGQEKGKNLYRINGGLDELNKTIVTSQDMRKLEKLPLYNAFFDRLASEVDGKIVLFIGYDLDDPDTMENISMVLRKLGKLKASAYFITSSSIINTVALNWLNTNDIKLLRENDKEFLEIMRRYMVSEGIIEEEPKEVTQKKKTLLM